MKSATAVVAVTECSAASTELERRERESRSLALEKAYVHGIVCDKLKTNLIIKTKSRIKFAILEMKDIILYIDQLYPLIKQCAHQTNQCALGYWKSN